MGRAAGSRTQRRCRLRWRSGSGRRGTVRGSARGRRRCGRRRPARWRTRRRCEAECPAGSRRRGEALRAARPPPSATGQRRPPLRPAAGVPLDLRCVAPRVRKAVTVPQPLSSALLAGVVCSLRKKRRLSLPADGSGLWLALHAGRPKKSLRRARRKTRVRSRSPSLPRLTPRGAAAGARGRVGGDAARELAAAARLSGAGAGGAGGACRRVGRRVLPVGG